MEVARTYKKKPGVCGTCSGPTSKVQAKHCLSCRRKNGAGYPDRKRYWHIQKKYNITREGFELLWTLSGGRCNICLELMQLPEKRRGQPLDACVLDHDHVTNEVRGLLCNGCNKALGLFKDDITLLHRAKEYLHGTKIGNGPTDQGLS